MARRIVLAALAVAVLAGCAGLRQPLEQRTTHGPLAEELFVYRSMLMNGREPTFDERRHWEDQLDLRIGRYLRQHPDAANALDVSTFRFYRQAAVGMSQEQVTILLGPPESRTEDAAEIEKLARRYWPSIRNGVTEAWTYPLGWSLYFDGPRLVEITQYLPR